MFRTLLLLFALLLGSGLEPIPTQAARPTAYARAKMKGRMYTHRPSYKIYKGHKKRGLFKFRKAGRGKATYSSKRRSQPSKSAFKLRPNSVQLN
jgi:curli biogenesis system outer membrane secretion channel CsgG